VLTRILTIGPQPDWYADVETHGGFRLDVPSILTSWRYVGGPTSSALRWEMLQTTVIIAYSTQITDYNLCHAQGATPMTMGSGIPAWQETDALPNPSGPSAIYGYARASLVLNGEAIQIQLEAPAPVDTFFARYGTIWQHMVASFGALPNQPISHARPCA
jgi:hypothetical protein